MLNVAFAARDLLTVNSKRVHKPLSGSIIIGDKWVASEGLWLQSRERIASYLAAYEAPSVDLFQSRVDHLITIILYYRFVDCVLSPIPFSRDTFLFTILAKRPS